MRRRGFALTDRYLTPSDEMASTYPEPLTDGLTYEEAWYMGSRSALATLADVRGARRIVGAQGERFARAKDGEQFDREAFKAANARRDDRARRDALAALWTLDPRLGPYDAARVLGERTSRIMADAARLGFEWQKGYGWNRP